MSNHPQTRIVRRAPGTPSPCADPADLLRRLYRARGESEACFDELRLDALLPYAGLKGIDAAVELVVGLIRRGGRILVVGDYDADGATGSSLAVRGLRALGAAEVDYLVPSRFAYGYGLSPPVVDVAAERRPDLIMTVDNGIASVEGVARANVLGIPVLVTDHHLPGAELPAAAAILNPNQPGCGFESKNLAGVGVVFYLLMALRARLRELDWFGPGRLQPNLAHFLDLVALGTVADVVTLDRNNRILVEQGLRRIRAGACSPGVRAILEISGKHLRQVTAKDLGFSAGPRLNAAGRLEDMSVGVECLICDDRQRADRLAEQLNNLNHRRREIEGEMKLDAEAMVEGDPPAGICLYAEGWHQGVTGIVAARIRERWHRPVIAFADADDGMLRGSARSIDGLHIRDVIDRVNSLNPGLIERFGGHAMAAGLSMAAAGLEQFRAAFDAVVRDALGDTEPVRELVSDGDLAPAALNLATAEALRHGGPWGKGFPEPLFDGRFEVARRRIVGERHLRLDLRLPDGGGIAAIGFGLGDELENAAGAVHLVYRLDVNEYRGSRAPQLVLEHLQSTT